MDDRPEDVSAHRAEAVKEVRGKQRSTSLITLGLILFFGGAALAANNTEGNPGGILLALLGIGLVVAGIVIRPRD